MKWPILLLLLFHISCIAMGQDRDNSNATPFTSRFFTGFKLRESFQGPDQALKPASIQLTVPNKGSGAWLIDGGIGVTVGKSSNRAFTSNLIGEFHRNTLVDSQQYNYQLGYNFGLLKTRGDRHTVPVYTGNVKYIRDVIDSTHSIAGSLNVSLYRTGRGAFNLGRPGFLSDYKYTYQLNPSIETQYQQVLASDKTSTGSILRPMINLAASFAYNKNLDPTRIMFPQKLIELSLEYDNRYAVVNSTNDGEKYTKLMRASANCYLFNTSTSAAAISASYNVGSDPLNGLKDQHFWRFSLQVQF